MPSLNEPGLKAGETPDFPESDVTVPHLTKRMRPKFA